jgi:hypothetical protein
MQRREALQMVALLLGGTIVGADVFLSGCKTPKKEGFGITADNVALLDEVGETILPTTADSPGAKAAQIGQFMKVIVTDCYKPEEQTAFVAGLDKLQESSRAQFGNDFLNLTADQKHTLCVNLDKEAKDFDSKKKDTDPNHYFAMIKQLTLWGYFTSEPGATKALRYVAVPGKYDGDFPYKKGDKAWAT